MSEDGKCEFDNDDDHKQALEDTVGVCRSCNIQRPLSGHCECKRPLKRKYLRKRLEAQKAMVAA